MGACYHRVMKTTPRAISPKELRLIAAIPDVRDLWGMETAEDVKQFVAAAQGAVIPYVSDGPEYAGELFVLLGGTVATPPTVIGRRAGKFFLIETAA